MYLSVLCFELIRLGIYCSDDIGLIKIKRIFIDWKDNFTCVCFRLAARLFDDSDVWLELDPESLWADEAGEKPISR